MKTIGDFVTRQGDSERKKYMRVLFICRKSNIKFRVFHKIVADGLALKRV